MTTTVEESFSQAIDSVKETFKKFGFGTLTEIDVRATLLEKTGEEIEPYTILGMCNPQLAIQSIRVEHEIGLFLPCNVLVHECGGKVHVSAQDPMLMIDMVRNEGLRPIAEEAKRRITLALSEIGSKERR